MVVVMAVVVAVAVGSWVVVTAIGCAFVYLLGFGEIYYFNV